MVAGAAPRPPRLPAPHPHPRKSKWVVYAKPPFARPEQVLTYVARYTHRVAVSNDCLIAIGDGKVRFR
jgi:hypothetical protein